MLNGVTTAISRVVEWARLAVQPSGTPEKIRRFYRVTCLSPPLRFGVHANNLVNLLRGIRERVYAVEADGGLVQPPRPQPGCFERSLEAFSKRFRREVVVTTPWSRDEFVATYEGRRATIYGKAAESLRSEPVTRRDSESAAFLKAEKIPFFAKKDPAPRLIHPRTPRYNVEVGVFIKKIEHEVYRTVDKVFGSKTILKGYNAQQVGGLMAGKWGRFNRPVAIGLDASRFDQHVSSDALKWEHERYLSYFAGSDRDTLARLLSWQLDTKCKARCSNGKVKYRVRGMRFSGDMNTGLGNCLIMCAMVWSWAHRQGVRCELANNGDDCVVIMDDDDLASFDLKEMVLWFRQLGFTMKVEEPVRDLERVEFCQSHPVFDGTAWVMVRKHRHSMAKDCISLKPLDGPGIFDKWRLAVGQAGMALTGGIPVQQAFYASMMRGAKGRALVNDLTLETGFARFARGMARTPTPVAAAARYSYWLAFGILPDEQVALEAAYDAITPTWCKPGCLEDPPVFTELTL